MSAVAKMDLDWLTNLDELLFDAMAEATPDQLSEALGDDFVSEADAAAIMTDAMDSAAALLPGLATKLEKRRAEIQSSMLGENVAPLIGSLHAVRTVRETQQPTAGRYPVHAMGGGYAGGALAYKQDPLEWLDSAPDSWFRPPRYQARKLFPHTLPRVRVGNYLYNLQNISVGGVAVLAPHGTESVLEVGEVVALTIQQSGFPIFESEARICRTETTLFGAKVAFHFLNNHVEFDTLLNRNAQAQIARRSALLNGETAQLVSKDYRAFCSDVLNVLRSYRAVLDENVNLASQFGHSFDSDGAYEACLEPLLKHWRSLWRTGNDHARSLEHNHEALAATKEFTEIVLTPEMRLGAIWDRSYSKPFGYPGDFGVMNQVYDWERRGDDVYQMLMHRLGLEVAECIKTCMEVVQGVIIKLVHEKSVDRTARIMSLGSGPAREVELFLAGSHSVHVRTEFTLIDQEQAALRYAFEKTYPHVVRLKDHARVRCLNMSFTEILKSDKGFEAVPPQDLIYSVGLLDYLVDRRAARLVQSLYHTLAPDGLLVIANMNDTSMSTLWPMEFITDWTMHYRTEPQLLSWVKDLQSAEAWTTTDSTERERLLFVRKRQAQ